VDNDYVTRKSIKKLEQAIISKIKQFLPEHSFIGEKAVIVAGDDDYKWDSSTHGMAPLILLKALPHFCGLIALSTKVVWIKQLYSNPS